MKVWKYAIIGWVVMIVLIHGINLITGANDVIGTTYLNDVHIECAHPSDDVYVCQPYTGDEAL